DTELHKEDLQAAGDPTSLGVASEEGAHPHLSSGMSAYNHNETVFSASTTFHSESTSGYDASADSTAKVDPRWVKTAHTNSGTNKESGNAEPSTKVKLEDLSQFMYDTRSAFLAPDSPTNNPIIISDESDEEKDADTNVDTSQAEPEDTLITKLSGELQELKKHVQGMEIELPEDLKDIPTKLEAFTSTVSSLTS
ncbi:hypothetical protein Tco_1149617, partial [Tanacetum coccineum]